MAHITSIKIEGLLGRKDTLQFDLQRDVNVFFGENGCGKTTLLKIMNAALNKDSNAMESLAVEKAEVNIFSINENKIIKHVWERKNKKKNIESEMIYLDENSNELNALDIEYFKYLKQNSNNEWKISLNKDAKQALRRWQHTFLPTTRLYLSETNARNRRPDALQLSENQLDKMFAEAINRSWLSYNAQTLNEVRAVQEEGLRTVLDNVLSITNTEKKIKDISDTTLKEIYERVLKFLNRQQNYLKLGTYEEFTKRYVKDKNLQKTVDNLNDVEKKIEKIMIPIENFKSTVQGLFSKNKSITTSDNEIKIKLDSGVDLSIANLSSGEKHLIKILFEAMTADSNSILIDEPELSMHIDWQRIFIKTVQSLNPNCQLIFASHSPEIMADISDEKIFKL